MKKSTLSIIALLIAVSCFAQERLAFPFQGGREVMTRFFKDSLAISPDLVKVKVNGVVMLKFTADEQGVISKTVIYYADDALLVNPVIEALKKSNHKWIIPNREKVHEFIIPFYIRYNLPENDDAEMQKAAMNNYRNRRPILPNNQVPLDRATLLPAVTVNYDALP